VPVAGAGKADVPAVADEFGMGTGDSGDPTSTNLYVGNIASTVTEEVLYK
jgi:hypothetical protein